MHTNFEDIIFNKQYHTYTLDGERLTSVTKIAYSVKPPFDSEFFANKKAQERGVSKDVILAEWEANRKASAQKGEMVHTYIEKFLTGEIVTDDAILSLNSKIPEMTAFDKFWNNSQGTLAPYAVEWIIGDRELGIAGTLDTIFMQGNELVLFDWKTGSKFGVSNRFGSLLYPFADLDDCELNNYSLQSSIYRLIVERNTDLTIKDGYIVYLVGDGSYQIHKALDLRGRVELWLKELKLNK